MEAHAETQSPRRHRRHSVHSITMMTRLFTSRDAKLRLAVRASVQGPWPSVNCAHYATDHAMTVISHLSIRHAVRARVQPPPPHDNDNNDDRVDTVRKSAADTDAVHVSAVEPDGYHEVVSR